jgi:Leucine-rich repeat (LRR) protein
MNGYMHFARNKNNICQIANFASYPIIKTASPSTTTTKTSTSTLDLTYLNANNRNITSVSDPNIYKGYVMSKIKTLFLERNQITALKSYQFALMLSLETLMLYTNSIRSLEPNWTNGLTNLVNLDLNNNQLSTLKVSDFDGLPNLRSLSLCFNGFKFLDASNSPFASLPSLISLDLTGNPIYNSISAVSFKSLNKLQSLTLRYCGIGSVNMDAFNSAFCMPTTSNTKIWMNGNPIVSSTEVAKLKNGICYNFNLVD